MRPPSPSRPVALGLARGLALGLVLGSPLGSEPAAAASPSVDLAKVRPLKEEWRAQGLAGQALAMVSDRGTRLVAFEDLPGSPARAIVLFDPQTGTVRWRTPPVAGVAWGALEQGDDGLGVFGEAFDGSGARLALVDDRDGGIEWVAAVPPGEVLVLGEHGGVASAGNCELTVRDPATGEPWSVLPGRVATVDAIDPGAAGSLQRLCAARPRLVGAVAGHPVVLAPDPRGDAWHLAAFDGVRREWDADLGRADAAPELDWRTSTLWTVVGSTLRLQRRDLASGRLAWDSTFDMGECRATVRGFDGVNRAPTLLVHLCTSLLAIDPHDGSVSWQATADGTPTVVGEGPVTPEPYQPLAAPLAVQWFSPAGARAGYTEVPAGAVGMNYGPGVLFRTPDAVVLKDRDDAVVWRVPIAATGWTLLGDVLALALPTGGRLVVDADDGAVLGTYPDDAAPTALVAVPGSENRRLLIVYGDGFRAFRLTGR